MEKWRRRDVTVAPHRVRPASQQQTWRPEGYRTGEETAKTIDAEVMRIIGESHDEAKRLLTAHRKQLDALAQALMERETLDELEILDDTGLPPAPALD